MALALSLWILAGCAGSIRSPQPAVAPASPSSAQPTAPAEAPAQPGLEPALPARGGPLHPVPAAAPSVRTLAEMTLGAVGDVLMHGAVKSCAAAHRVAPGPGAPGNDEGYGWLYAPIADLLAQPDLTFANLETPVAPRSDRGSRSFVFNAPVAAVQALAHAGVDVVSVANNHLFDQGRGGFLETLARLEEVGMPYIGAGPAPGEAGPRRFEVRGLSIAFLAWATFFNEAGSNCPPTAVRSDAPACVTASLLDRERAIQAVRAAAAAADAVVVSLHWGTEYAQQPRAEDVAFAHRLADAGALVVLGHHPHVLQPIELYRRADGRVAVIAYSLGNFISNQSRGYVEGVTPDAVAATREGALVRVRIARRDYGGGVVRVEVGGADYLPLWTENDTPRLDRRRDPRAAPSIRVVSLDRALAAVRVEIARMPDPVPAEQASRWVDLRRREELYLKRKEAIAAVLGADLEGAPPLNSPAP